MALFAITYGLPTDVSETVQRALVEDIGTGDVTSQYTVPADIEASALMIAKASGVIAGLPVAAIVFTQVDPSLEVQLIAVDGQAVELAAATLCSRFKAARAASLRRSEQRLTSYRDFPGLQPGRQHSCG